MRTAILFATCAFGLTAQTPSPVVGVGTFIHVVADLDKTIHFYGDVLGLERGGAPGSPAFAANAVVEGLYDAKGSQSRVVQFKIPNSPLGVEFVEFKGIAQKPFRPRRQDPGASVLTVPVRDVNAVMAALGEKSRFVQDPDGFYIQLADAASPARLTLTVAEMDKTLHLFRDLLGFQPVNNKAKVPGTDFEVEFSQGQGAKPNIGESIHDPGAGVLRLIVRDVDALLATLKSAGVPVVSAGGEPVSAGDRHFVILRDPDNFFFQLFPQPQRAQTFTR
jgi:catechol 2,3-dioxygenase-like lactoylglutathione lyase family enzyme